MTFAVESQSQPQHDRRYRSRSGVAATFTSTAALRRLDAAELSVLMYPSDELEAGPANLYLRLHLTTGIVATGLLGPAGAARVAWTKDGPLVRGRWRGLDFRAQFRLADDEPAWFWHVAVANSGPDPVTVDVVHTQDVALAPYAAVRTNEFYVAQYLDVSPVETEAHGTMLAIRQNMPGERAPWLALGSLRQAVAWGTDALQLVGRSASLGVLPAALLVDRLPSTRLQHEHTLAMLQDRAERLAPGQTLTTGFFGICRPDHPGATGPADAAVAARARALPEAEAPPGPTPDADADAASEDPAPVPFVASLFSSAPALVATPLDEPTLTRLAGPGHHQVERHGDQLLAYFTDDGTHVVTAAKERAVLRPHGHILRTGTSLVPDPSSLTSTAWMAGVFASQVTQGHASRDPVLSIRRGYLGQRGAFGLRIFVAPAAAPGGGTPPWALLDQPSAWTLTPDACRWWYQHERGLIEVTATVAAASHEIDVSLRVHAGEPVRALVCAHVAFGGDDGADPQPPDLAVDALGVTVRAPAGSPLAQRSPGSSFRLAWAAGAIDTVADDGPLFDDAASRDLPWVTLASAPTLHLELALTVDIVAPDLLAEQDLTEQPWPDFWAGIEAAIRLRAPDASPWAAELGRLNAVLPWFTHDALVHYLAPRGLEQYSGGAWGTRDACQGPVGLLLALGQTTPLRDLVLRILAAQNSRGDWPQWFEFWAGSPRTARAGAHGDVVFWPLLAVGEYLAATQDATLLDELVPFVGESGDAAPALVLEHLQRALAHITASTVPGSPLPAYGHGDWNDSLQPADPALAARLCSTWTVTLEVHALRTIAGALRGLPRAAPSGPGSPGRSRTDARTDAFAANAEDLAERATEALQTVLVHDGLLCGYGLFRPDGTVEHLVHPSDTRTGLHHSVLPMIHAISGDLLSPASARTHLATLDQHLLGPDGARLFDRPARYQGGPMEIFQRAEAATFFGREIGIMYTHAHLRYAEALARHGDAEALLPALLLVNPIGIAARVPSAAPRQSTCFYSSSDAAFADRYDAAAHYARIGSGEVALEGGWRVYSSGPGLFLRLVVEQLLGVRRRGETLELDPVLPPSLDGLTASVQLEGLTLDLTYTLGRRGVGPTSVTLDGSPLPTTPLTNPYRSPGVGVPLARVLAALRAGHGALHVTTG